MCNVVVNIGTVSLGTPQAPGAGEVVEAPDHPSAVADVDALRQQLAELRGYVERCERGSNALWHELTRCYPLDPNHPVARSWKLRLVHDQLLRHIEAVESRVTAVEAAQRGTLPQHGGGRRRIAAR